MERGERMSMLDVPQVKLYIKSGLSSLSVPVTPLLRIIQAVSWIFRLEQDLSLSLWSQMKNAEEQIPLKTSPRVDPIL